MLIRITAPHFCAGIDANVIKQGYLSINRCAPIVKYMTGWTAIHIKKYCQSKNWKFEIVGDKNESDKCRKI